MIFKNISCLDYLKEKPNESYDLVLTDPPYGIDYVILFVDYKKDYYTLDLFVSVFNEYLKNEAKSEIENFMKDYKQWNYYIIKELFRLLKSKYLLKD